MVLLHTPTVALLGNPNTGKTTLFNALAGMNQRVGNYPGVTVETKKGKLRHGSLTFDLVDLPGTYSLAPRSPDEMVAVDLILGQQTGEPRPDVVVTIVDASNLERNLYLATQALELGVPVVVALNMVDVAHGQGITVDARRLAQQLGVPVVPIQANRRVGLDALKEAIAAALEQGPPGKMPTFPEAFEREVDGLRSAFPKEVPAFLLRRLLLDVGGYTERRLDGGAALETQIKSARLRLTEQGCPVPAVEARVRYGWIRHALEGCVRRPTVRPVTWTDRLDRVLTHKVWGTLIFLLLMFAVFQSIFTLAKPLMDYILQGQTLLADWVQSLMAAGPLRSLLADGVIKGVGSVLVFLPQIAILFAVIAVLEDCGYMARAAFLMDKLMSRCGLSGKSFIPLLSSVACAVPGIMAARVIENRRDRLATIVVAPLMSCSARLPVYTLLIGAFLSEANGFSWWVPGVAMFGLYAIGLVLAPLVAWMLKSSLLRGETPMFVMEMPLYKLPSLRTVVRRVFDSGWMFVRRAGTLILATMIVVWALLYFPHTDPQGRSYDERIAALEDREITFDGAEMSLDDLRKKAEELEEAEDRAELKRVKKVLDPVEDQINELRRDWAGQSLLGQMGHAIEPAVRPLGWDWRIGVAALASFPAREVMVGTLGLIFSQGKGASDDARYVRGLGEQMKAERWQEDAERPLFTVPVALSVLVFFALCCQCGSTLAVIARETKSWRWPAFTFVYMTALAYLGALLTYQIGSLF